MTSPTRSPRSSLYKSHPELFLNLGSCLAVLAILAIVSYLLARERESVEQSAIRSSSNIVQLIESDILRNVELYDQSLQGLIWAVGRPELPEVPSQLRQRLLFNEAFVDRRRGDVLWLDAHGDVVGDSTSIVPRKANFRDTGVFKAHQGNPNLGLLIGPPFKARLGELDWCISFSRRINGPHGEFAGLAAGALRLAYFSELFQRLDIGDDSSINLLNADGQLLARQPTRPHDPLIGTDFSERPNFKRILGERSGTFSAKSILDDTQHLYTFARVADLPLIVLVVHASDEVFESWRRTAIVVSVATGLLCIGILWLTCWAASCAAVTTPSRAWPHWPPPTALRALPTAGIWIRYCGWNGRAQRNRRPLAILMVDVDHFKAFNQRHGHAGGDHALREVAKSIERCIRRPADLAARYGGEEFQVVLPETELAGALLLAERIRASVEQLAPLGDDTQSVTVSIGIGLYIPGTQQDLARLLGAADEALYRAKANGRNRVEGPLD